MRHLIAIRKTVITASRWLFALSLFVVIIFPASAQEPQTSPRAAATASPRATAQPTATAPTSSPVSTASVASTPTPTPSESANTNAGVTPTASANSNSAPGTGAATGRFTFGNASGEGPVWFVLIVFGVIVLLAIGSFVFARKIQEKMSLSANWIIILLISGAVIFFFGVWFGWSKSQPVSVLPLTSSPTTILSTATTQTPAATSAPTATSSPAASSTTASTTTSQPAPSTASTTTSQPASTSPTTTPASTSPTASQTPKETPTPYALSVSQVTVANGKQVAGLGDTIAITVKNLKEELAREQNPGADAERVDVRRYVLFLNDMEVKKLYPSAFDPELGTLSFQLSRTPESKDVWTTLLAGQGSSIRVTKASVGPESKTALPSRGTFNLRIYDSTLFYIGVIAFTLLVLGFLWLARRTSIIRDSGPPQPPPGTFRPYSLARSQVAWWFFIIIGSFLFIMLVTQDFDTITNSSLVLLGIGTGTALGAAMVDANKRESTNSTLLTLKPRQASLAEVVAQLTTQVAGLKAKEATTEFSQSDRAALDAAKQELTTKTAELVEINKQVDDAASTLNSPVSDGFLNDILSDVNGVTFHRFQMIVWTIILGLIFIWSVWKKLTMPEFSDILLALMGISAGTYIGFKIPERQTAAAPGTQTVTTPAQPPLPPG